MNYLHKYKSEILFIIVFFCLSFIQPKLGGVFLIFEAIFLVTLTLAMRAKARQDDRSAIYYYSINRVVGFIQPLLTLIIALFIRMSLVKELEADTVLIFDLCLTIISLQIFNNHFMALRVRPATIDDVDALVNIEEKAFTEEQRASRSQIKKRLMTHDETCLVAVDRKQRVVGSLFLRPVNRDEVLAHDFTHKQIQHDDDFSPELQDDSLYVVGLQALPVRGVQVAAYLLAGAMRLTTMRGYKGLLGGPRLPEYCDHVQMSLDDFIRSPHAHFLHALMHIGKIPGLAKMVVLKGLHDYFPDPQSLNAAALAWWATPCRILPAFLRHGLAEIIFLAGVVN